jgi:decaprenylphospho-beta-D-ribofuranose 2-oxidase
MISKKIFSFDGNEFSDSFIIRPDKKRFLINELNSKQQNIAMGAGLSYALSFAGNNVKSIMTHLFNRILNFDIDKMLITVEPGISIGDMLKFLIEKGYWFSVTPGYPKITIGGCLGNNIHGKSQYHYGNIIDHIEEINLYHPDHGEIICNRNKNIELFNLTIGGFGLTGIIIKVVLRFQKLKGFSINRKKIKVKNLIETAFEMIKLKDNYDQIYSWNNLNLSKKNFGRGFIYCESFSNEINQKIIEFKNLSTDARNTFFYQITQPISQIAISPVFEIMESMKKDETNLSLLEAAFPINGKEIYFNSFGKKGFREYQLIIPFKNWELFVQELYTLIQKKKVLITLSSLKIFKGKQKYLYFSQDGVCLAIDIPSNQKTTEFFNSLDELMKKYEGIPNISKDSRLTPKIAKCYTQYEIFKKDIRNFDPKIRFNSSLRERLEI